MEAEDLRHVELLVSKERELREQQFESAQDAIRKEAVNMTLRLEAQNGVLTLMKEQQQFFVRTEIKDEIERRLTALERQRDTWKGGASALWAAAGAVVALIAVWAGVFR
jgi:hypothetical protein